MHIAYCIQGEAFQNDSLRDPQVSYRYPGSGWISALYQAAAARGIEVASGDVALKNIATGKWNAKDTFLVQDMESAQASALLQAGAVPFLITCLEAPLYAPFFYDQVKKISAGFRYRYGFGLNDNGQTQGQPEWLNKFRFPSFYQSDVLEMGPPQQWLEREKLVLVAANKFKSNKLFFPKAAGPRDLLRQIKWLGWRVTSPAYEQSLQSCLHESRLQALDYFASHGAVHVYGSGWGDMRGMPLTWARRLGNNTGFINHGMCESKLQTLKNYRFSLCFENIAMPGYITEKIIDCFVAGVVPVYRGAPNILDYIPSDAFVPADSGNYADVDQRLASMDADQALHMVEAGRHYLASKQGALHSYEGFAAAVLELALE